jgi:hypothetical protein
MLGFVEHVFQHRRKLIDDKIIKPDVTGANIFVGRGGVKETDSRPNARSVGYQNFFYS